MSTRILAAGLALSVATSACASAVPPPPEVASRPDPVLPDLASAPAKPPAGLGVVVFDSVSGPATVSRVVGHGRQSSTTVTGFGWISSRGRSTATETICPQTPCVGYLPYGDHEVILESTSPRRRRRAPRRPERAFREARSGALRRAGARGSRCDALLPTPRACAALRAGQSPPRASSRSCRAPGSFLPRRAASVQSWQRPPDCPRGPWCPS
jgi:hypothetical protein